MKEDLLSECIEVELPTEENFLLVKETLSRIGIASKKEKILWPTCHILHKQGRYYIMMFKELFKLDGKPTNITEEDLARRNTIIALLSDWKLITIVSPMTMLEPRASMGKIKIIPYKEKDEWKICPKYTVGKSKV